MRCSIYLLIFLGTFFLLIYFFCPHVPSSGPLHVENNSARRYSEEQRLMATGLTVMSTSDKRRAGSGVAGGEEAAGLGGSRRLKESRSLHETRG